MAGAATRRLASTLFYGCTIFAGAFLLFQIQPLIAKVILPWFGGTAAVWTTCLVFFQMVLLLGYLYAHWTTEHLPGRFQAGLHVALLAASLLLVPVYPNPAWKPNGSEDPILRILGLLFATVGLPYFLLASTGPLMQAWYVASRSGAFPYRFYALSNAASMLALLSYPLLLEPFASTRTQAHAWSAGYGLFVALSMVLALRRRRSPEFVRPDGSDTETAAPAGWAVRLLWIALPACASALLLAVTNHLTQNIASIPFLWIVPLSLYLLSFILCFDRDTWYHRALFLRLLAMALAIMAYTLTEDLETVDLKVLIPIFSAALFVCSMVCHGELARLKPHPRYLTSYYLMIALGGAVGGMLVGYAAPRVFGGYYELPVAIALCGALALMVLFRDSATPLYRGGQPATWVVILGVYAAILVCLAMGVQSSVKGYRVRERNFYGSLRVSDQGAEEIATRKLMNGSINHGEQFLDPGRSRTPTTYYGRNSGVGLALLNSGRQPQRVGVIGLGAGTLAAYGRKDDYYRFYEINPQVIRLAYSEFRFLRESEARVEVVLGDARLSLEREAPQQFDVLAVDAFSSDSIPVHLLTREAFQLYFRHLKPDGILAVHVSNRYLELEPVVERIATALGRQCLSFDTEDDHIHNVFGATWVLVSSRPGLFDQPVFSRAGIRIQPHPNLRVWTDDYSNLVRILK